MIIISFNIYQKFSFHDIVDFTLWKAMKQNEKRNFGIVHLTNWLQYHKIRSISRLVHFRKLWSNSFQGYRAKFEMRYCEFANMRNGKREHSSLEMDVNVCLETLATDKMGRPTRRFALPDVCFLFWPHNGKAGGRNEPIRSFSLSFEFPVLSVSPFRIRIDICMLYTRQGKARSSLFLSPSFPSIFGCSVYVIFSDSLAIIILLLFLLFSSANEKDNLIFVPQSAQPNHNWLWSSLLEQIWLL